MNRQTLAYMRPIRPQQLQNNIHHPTHPLKTLHSWYRTCYGPLSAVTDYGRWSHRLWRLLLPARRADRPTSHYKNTPNRASPTAAVPRAPQHMSRQEPQFLSRIIDAHIPLRNRHRRFRIGVNLNPSCNGCPVLCQGLPKGDGDPTRVSRPPHTPIALRGKAH